MKYCTHCGAQIHDEAVICVKCGCSAVPFNPVVQQPVSETHETLEIVVKVFLILSCVATGWLLIPLAWCIPMTVSIFKSFKERRPVSTAMAVCTLLFVNVVAGVCLLCMGDR